jgi:hypothetical protein
MVQNNQAKKKLESMRVQKYAFLAVKVKTAKTAKNRPRGHFQKKSTSFRWLIKDKRSYQFRILKVKAPQFPLLHLQTARRCQHIYYIIYYNII